MDPKELRGLMEAYAEVYAPQEVDELYKGKHGQSETEYMDSRSDAGKQISGTSKLSGAAYSHRSYKGVGSPAKPGERQKNQGKMTPADRNELAIRKANLKKEELEQVGEAVKGASRHDTEMRKAAASERRSGIKPLPAKEGEKYAKYKMAQMDYAKRKRMGEEVSVFDVVLEFLQAEGFAETLEEAEWLMANVIDEEAIGIILGEEQLDEISDRRVQGMLAKREKQDRDSGGISSGYLANRRAQQAAARRNVRTGSNVRVDPILSKEEYELGEEQLDEISDRRVQGMLAKREKQDRDSGGISSGYLANRRAQQAAARRNVRTGSNVRVDPILSKEEYELGEGHGSRTSFKTQSADERKRIGMFKGSKIEYTPHKNYDPEANRGQGQILRPNQAEKQRRKKLAKSAMGEEYMDEAQAARENPEKYEREQSKKSAPVRGERTPMPPRGDKRREDFEKWYAKNVR